MILQGRWRQRHLLLLMAVLLWGCNRCSTPWLCCCCNRCLCCRCVLLLLLLLICLHGLQLAPLHPLPLSLHHDSIAGWCRTVNHQHLGRKAAAISSEAPHTAQHMTQHSMTWHYSVWHGKAQHTG